MHDPRAITRRPISLSEPRNDRGESSAGSAFARWHRRLALCTATAIVAAGVSAVITPAQASSSSCPQPNPFGRGLSLSPPNGQLPTGAAAEFEAVGGAGGVVPLKPSAVVTFKVICGPNTGETATKTVTPHPNSEPSGVPGAYFRDVDTHGAGTDIISATAKSGASTFGPATISVTWTPPVNCGQPLSRLGYLRALQCKLAAAKPLVKTVLQVGECAVGVATFFAPEAKLVKLVQDADKAATLESLAGAAAVGTPLAKFAFDLAAIQKKGIVSFTQLKDTFEDAKSLPDFLHNIADLLSTIPSGDVSQIALDVANLTGLGPCVTLLAKVITTKTPANFPTITSATFVDKGISLTFKAASSTSSSAVLYYMCEASPDSGTTAYTCDGGANGVQGSFGTTSPQTVPASLYGINDPFGFTPIQPGWSLHMWAVTAKGPGPKSPWFTIKQDLGAPTIRSATLSPDSAALFGQDVSLSFDAPAATPGLTILYYVCEASPDAGITVYTCDGGANGVQGSFGTSSPQTVPASLYGVNDPLGFTPIQPGWSIRMWAVTAPVVGEKSPWVVIR